MVGVGVLVSRMDTYPVTRTEPTTMVREWEVGGMKI